MGRERGRAAGRGGAVCAVAAPLGPINSGGGRRWRPRRRDRPPPVPAPPVVTDRRVPRGPDSERARQPPVRRSQDSHSRHRQTAAAAAAAGPSEPRQAGSLVSAHSRRTPLPFLCWLEHSAACWDGAGSCSGAGGQPFSNALSWIVLRLPCRCSAAYCWLTCTLCNIGMLSIFCDSWSVHAYSACMLIYW